MLKNLQPSVYQRKARLQLQDIKHHIKLLTHFVQQINAVSIKSLNSQKNNILENGEKLKNEIRQKLKSIGSNIDQMIAVLDYKITLISKQLQKIQKSNENCREKKVEKNINDKIEQQYKFKINQLQQRIFELQKKQNQHVKQISDLKQKNGKLRQDFSDLSFDSNQRIRQLSEKLHNNTSPNLTIKRVSLNNPQNHAEIDLNQNEKKKRRNNFVKIKGITNFDQQLNNIDQNNVHKNLLDSFTSQQSEYDIRNFKHQNLQFEQNSGNLKFGCFPHKQNSQKTKTGSTSQNKKLKLEQKNDKNRRFEFLLNNLVEKKPQQIDRSQQTSHLYQKSSYGNNQVSLAQNYNYKPLTRGYESTQYKSVFDQNAIKKYQI